MELPRRLIELYTYLDEVVLDPFIGAGATALAAIETGRRYVGYETDDGYADRAEERIEALFDLVTDGTGARVSDLSA